MTSEQFDFLFCRHFNCSPSEYEDWAFRQLLYPHARLVARLIRMMNPGFFVQDFKFIRYLGEATDLREAKTSAADFQDANAGKRNFWRTGLRIRISGLKASRLADQLFAQSGFR